MCVGVYGNVCGCVVVCRGGVWGCMVVCAWGGV